MEDYFLKKFESKSDQELLQIIGRKESYQRAAVNAAIELYNERNSATISRLYDQEESITSETDKGSILTSFTLRPFFRTLSYREFLTSFALGSFYIAFLSVVEYYSDEIESEGLDTFLKWVVGIVLILISHMMYRFEHGRSNNFIGRAFHDLISFVFLVLIRNIYFYIVHDSVSFIVDGGLGVFIVILFFVVLFTFFIESIVAFIKFILRLLRWQIF